MSKPTRSSIELSDAEKRDLIQLIQAGKPLPERYRFLLFENKREVELVGSMTFRVDAFDPAVMLTPAGKASPASRVGP